MPGKPVRIYFLREEDLFDWFDKHALVPKGSRLTGTDYDLPTGTYVFRVENPSFDVVPEGVQPPRKRLEYNGD